jgi:hypothetical protein
MQSTSMRVVRREMPHLGAGNVRWRAGHGESYGILRAAIARRGYLKTVTVAFPESGAQR